MHRTNTPLGRIRRLPGGARLASRALALPVSLLAMAPVFAATCAIGLLPPLEVTMRDLKPLVHAQLNGKEALFVATAEHSSAP